MRISAFNDKIAKISWFEWIWQVDSSTFIHNTMSENSENRYGSEARSVVNVFVSCVGHVVVVAFKANSK